MKKMTVTPLTELSGAWSPLQQKMVSPGDSPAKQEQPEGMVLVPRTKYVFQTGGVEIEGGCDPSDDTFGADICCPDSGSPTCPGDEGCADMCAFRSSDDHGVDVQYPWESYPHRFHSHIVDIGPFYIDQYLVTNAEYARYLDQSGFVPEDDYNYLKDFNNSGSSHKPVTWVSLREARAYCSWKGGRLPHAYEWQLAGQGTDGRIYPWGDELDLEKFPTVSHDSAVPQLPDVGSFPEGNSPFNVSDMVGLVWQYTDEFEDPHTRGVVMKGSSLFNPILSGDFPSMKQPGNWYFPQAKKLIQHNRFLLMDDSYERAATVGFRCVAQHPDGAAGPYHIHPEAVESFV